jgi:Lrp/AsnC family leucine-responsive transcriptional regulator
MLDQKDLLLLKLLQENSRISASEVGGKLNLSVPAASERIKKLLEGGYIKKFTAQLDSKKLGYDLTAFISVDSDSSSHYEDIVERSNENDFVLECHSVTGEGSHLLKIRLKTSTDLESLLSEIQGWPGVIRTHTWVVLSSFKESLNLKIKTS